MSPENSMAPPTSQKRIDANRRNAQKSTGPRTPEGKSRSRFNGLKHGLAATVPVLPGEDPAAFLARVDAVVKSPCPQNQVEFDLLERVAVTSWSFERAARAEAAKRSQTVRHDAIEREQNRPRLRGPNPTWIRPLSFAPCPLQLKTTRRRPSRRSTSGPADRTQRGH
jgi:hypothetical protein